MPKHNGTRHAFWAKADCGNFGPLLQGTEWKHAEASGKQWKAVEDSGRVRSCVKVSGRLGRPGRGQEGHGRGQKRWERLGKVAVHYRVTHTETCYKRHVELLYPLINSGWTLYQSSIDWQIARLGKAFIRESATILAVGQ